MTFIEALARQVPDFPREKLAQAFVDAARHKVPLREPHPPFVGPLRRERKRLPRSLLELIAARTL